MVWSNPPDEVTALRDMLKLCAASTAHGLNADARYHYPQAALGTDDATSLDTMPLVVIADTDSSIAAVGEIGAGGLTTGTLSATIHADLGIGVLETLARTLRTQLMLLSTGLANLRVQCGVCSDPKNAHRAADNDGGNHANSNARTITLTCTYGLES